MPITLPLSVDKTLLDSSFDGYKLSLDALSTYKSSLKAVVKDPIFYANEDQSYLWTKLVGLFNNLKCDLYSSTNNATSSLYLCDTQRNILNFQFTNNEKFKAPFYVWKIPDHKLEYNSGDDTELPVSISFPSKELALVSDGKGHIYILDTGDRTSDAPNQWKLVYQDYHPLQNTCPFVILQSTMHDESEDRPGLDCLLFWISTTSENGQLKKFQEKDILYASVIDQLKFKKENEVWSVYQTRRMVSSSYPDYVNIDSVNDVVLVASEKEFTVVYDSLDPVIEQDPKVEVNEDKNDADSDSQIYCWNQTEEEVSINFVSHKDLQKNDINVKLTPSTISVSIRDTKILDHKLLKHIDVDGSVWTLSDQSKLDIALLKKDIGVHWSDLVEGGDEKGKELDDEEVVQQFQKLGPLPSQEPVFNSGEYEECDFDSLEAFHLQRIDMKLHKTTHEIDLIGRQFLFSEQLNNEEFPVMCLRHDVDGIIWQPKSSSESFSCDHIGTFNALGYVQASKQDKKFLLCPPSFGYAALASVKRHIHVYRQPTPLDCSVELRNRKSGRKVSSVAKQSIISLQSTNNIIGMVAANDRIFILTTENLYAIDIK